MKDKINNGICLAGSILFIVLILFVLGLFGAFMIALILFIIMMFEAIVRKNNKIATAILPVVVILLFLCIILL